MRVSKPYMPKISPDKFKPLKPIKENTYRHPEGMKLNRQMTEMRRGQKGAMKRAGK